jgi:hypothetical protein
MLHTRRSGLGCLAVATLLVGANGARAADAEDRCQSGRAKAAARYLSCAQKAVAKYHLTTLNLAVYASAASKCVTK